MLALHSCVLHIEPMKILYPKHIGQHLIASCVPKPNSVRHLVFRLS
jgi:hypothetical protein